MIQYTLSELVNVYLGLHLEYHPVDATFMGISGYDHRLPPASADALDHERSELSALKQRIASLPLARTREQRIEVRLLSIHIRFALRTLQQRPRFYNPVWYIEETAFGVISLLLAGNPHLDKRELHTLLSERLKAIPAFLSEGQEWLKGRSIPQDWVKLAQFEARAIIALLERGLPLHPLWNPSLELLQREAVRAIRIFEASLEDHSDADPACGEDYLSFLMREVHGLLYTPAEAEEMALEGVKALRGELEAQAARLDSSRSWRDQLDQIESQHLSSVDEVLTTYRTWNEAVLEQAADLVTPASEYGLEFKWLPQWANEVAGNLYFLFYRSPAPACPGEGSIYWVPPAGEDEAAYLSRQNLALIKIVHVIHHGSIGHHTQNARARVSPSRLAQLAGTDCASGIAFLSGGTTIEGWACYVQDLMTEVENFYTPQELLLLKHFEMRNAATCLADIRLHRGVWSLEQVRQFYQKEVGYSPSRIWSDTVRNSIFPASRLMYWLGTQTIKALRAELSNDPQNFHDSLLSYGSIPITWIAEEMRKHEI